jgi:TonB family protein
MKRLWLGFSLLLINLILSTASGAFAQSPLNGAEQPTVVVKAVAPKSYPPIAMAARAGGRVIIRVTINPKGEVTATKLVSGHVLLDAVSQRAARKWLFAAAEKKDADRFVELEFIYTVASKEEDASVFFKPPYTVEIIRTLPEINTTNN